MTRRRIAVAERRARAVLRQRLHPTSRADRAVDAARSVVALHATDALTVFLSVLARTEGVRPADIERALYDDRTLVRHLGMRRTLFAIPRELVPVVHASSTRAVAVRERRTLEGLIRGSGITADPGRWLADVEPAALATVAERGTASTAEVVDAVPALAARVRMGAGTRWEVGQSAGSRVLALLAMDARLVRAHPRGTWVSSQFRWATTDAWLGELEQCDPAPARAALLAHWLRAFGPGTEADLRWWTGWPLRDVRAALAAVPHEEVELDGANGYALADDLERTPEPEPAAALLPVLDPTTMGWRDREWYLGPHGPTLFDSVGNAGPTVWWAGHIVGGWAQRPDGEIVTGLLEDIGADAEAAIAVEAARVSAWLGDARLAPRVLPPFQRSLVN